MAGLYIHIPFCGRRCGYCDFYSTTSPERVEAFLRAVKREMTCRNGRTADGGFFFAQKLDTIYVGGGTPSLLAPEQLQGLLDHAAGLWDCTGLREVTLEANPEDLTDDYLTLLSGTGFKRLSIGVQSFDDGLLRLMNRRHNAARAREAVRTARRAGFDNISIDLIYGIPGMSDAQWVRSLDEATGLGVQHISAYHLTIEPGTAFGRLAAKSESETNHPVGRSGRHPSTGGELPFRPVTGEVSERQFATLREKLGAAGFEHYEISNFALPGRRAVHNSAYWTGAPYLGVGPSAHSFDGARRREWVVADLERYIADPTYEGETLTEDEIANERVMTGLRTAEGIEVSELRIMNYELRIAFEGFLRDGLLVLKNGRVAIPPEKFLLSDHIISTLFWVD